MNVPSPMRTQSGFSLLELLVVVSVIALMAAMMASGLQGRDGSKLSAAQEILISQVQAARNTAVARNATCRLLVDAGTNQDNGRRRLALAVKSRTPGSTKWEVPGTPAKLPDGTALLVADGETPATTQDGSASAPQIMPGSDMDAANSLPIINLTHTGPWWSPLSLPSAPVASSPKYAAVLKWAESLPGK